MLQSRLLRRVIFMWILLPWTSDNAFNTGIIDTTHMSIIDRGKCSYCMYNSRNITKQCLKRISFRFKPFPISNVRNSHSSWNVFDIYLMESKTSRSYYSWQNRNFINNESLLIHIRLTYHYVLSKAVLSTALVNSHILNRRRALQSGMTKNSRSFN